MGAGIDSYYEYLYKAHVLLHDDGYLQAFETHYAAVLRHLKHGPFLFGATMHAPGVPRRQVDALQFFFPGLQVLYGDLEPAAEIFETCGRRRPGLGGFGPGPPRSASMAAAGAAATPTCCSGTTASSPKVPAAWGAVRLLAGMWPLTRGRA